jgi:hypothetical protein
VDRRGEEADMGQWGEEADMGGGGEEVNIGGEEEEELKVLQMELYEVEKQLKVKDQKMKTLERDMAVLEKRKMQIMKKERTIVQMREEKAKQPQQGRDLLLQAVWASEAEVDTSLGQGGEGSCN